MKKIISRIIYVLLIVFSILVFIAYLKWMIIPLVLIVLTCLAFCKLIDKLGEWSRWGK